MKMMSPSRSRGAARFTVSCHLWSATGEVVPIYFALPAAGFAAAAGAVPVKSGKEFCTVLLTPQPSGTATQIQARASIKHFMANEELEIRSAQALSFSPGFT